MRTIVFMFLNTRVDTYALWRELFKDTLNNYVFLTKPCRNKPLALFFYLLL